MLLERIQVDEGFLDGLDVRFTPGLNVLIGARGTGKTSVIELLRFALGVGGTTTEATKRSVEHAKAVLGSGQVTVTASVGSQLLVITRTATDVSPRASSPYSAPIIFSQTEIETVGLQPSGRLRLIDSFVTDRLHSGQEEQALASQISSATAEIDGVAREISALDAQLSDLPAVEAALADIAPKEEQLATSSAAAAEHKGRLDAVSGVIASLSITMSFLERFGQTVRDWHKPLDQLYQNGPDVESWVSTDEEDPAKELRSSFTTAVESVAEVADQFAAIEKAAAALVQKHAADRVRLEEAARELRRSIESVQQGAGTLARQAAGLRERKAQLQALEHRTAERRQKLASLQERRGRLLDDLDRLREHRFQARTNIAAKLSKDLGPRIRVSVSRAGLVGGYADAVADALRGSGLRYTELASQIAERMSPRELLESAEANDFNNVADIVGINRDRAARVVAHLREKGLGDLATCQVEDDVGLLLLDGQDFKPITNLSTGQRCTVILPLILEHQERVVVVDQPEDHIDNAFIAETLIRAVRNRPPESQVIFSTHNANIPVLGNANNVVHLGSDGRRGFVLSANPLDNPRSVSAITNVMEGGRQAFEQRAKFYTRHGS